MNALRICGKGCARVSVDVERSSRPSAVADYALAKAADDMTGLPDTLGVESAHVVGHDWGAAVGVPVCHGSRACRRTLRAGIASHAIATRPLTR